MPGYRKNRRKLRGGRASPRKALASPRRAKLAYSNNGVTQIRAPSNEVCPPTLTVRFDCTVPEQAVMPAGGGGTTKLIWYSPTYPATRPENSGTAYRVSNSPGNVREGWLANAFGRKLKSSMKVSYVGVAVAAAWPVGTAGVVNPSPTA